MTLPLIVSPSVDVGAYAGRPCPYCRLTMRRPPTAPAGQAVVAGGRYRMRVDTATKDHVVPKSRKPGGPHHIIVCCARCNNQKGNMTLAEWLACLKGTGDIRALYVANLLDLVEVQAIAEPPAPEPEPEPEPDPDPAVPVMVIAHYLSAEHRRQQMVTAMLLAMGALDPPLLPGEG